MASPEPVLTDEDRYWWEEVWTPALLAHAETRAFCTHLAQAVEHVRRAMEISHEGIVMVSGGKDSSALGEVIYHEIGASLPCASEKDDLDYPGEEDLLATLGERWGVSIEVLRPPFSLQQWLRDNAHGMSAADPIHSRLSTFSQAGFYDVVEARSRKHQMVFLGLRKEESAARLVDRATHGPLYQRGDGQWRCCPLIDWTGKDVLAYCLSRGVPLLPLYQCCAFPPEYQREPWRIRKSWWLPGKSARWGGAAWLRRYYPSLYRNLCDLFHDARSMV